MLTILFRVSQSIALLILLGTGCAYAHTLAATPNLQLKTSGSVYDVLLEPDGHLIVAGLFEEVGGLPRRNLARLNADGTVDPNWSFDTNGTVYSVARSSTGQVFVAGDFSEIAGLQRNGLARISGGPGAPGIDAWVPDNISRPTVVRVVAGDDVLIIANRIVRHIPAGSATMDPVDSSAAFGWDIAVSPDGQRVATCSYSGEVDLRTRTDTLLWRKNWEGYCNEIAFAPDGSLFVARGFEDYVTPRFGQVISRILPSGEFDAAWERDFGQAVDSFAFLPTGVVWIGTYKNRAVRSNAWDSGFHHARGGELYRFQANGTPIVGDGPEADSNYETLTVLPGGDVLASGSFKIVGHERRDALVRLAPSFGLRPQMTSLQRTSRTINAVLRLQDGGYLISGPFTSIDGQPRRMLARLDAAFVLRPETWELDTVAANLTQDASGNCYIGALFPPAPEYSPSTLIRLDGCSSIDPAWRPLVDDAISTMVMGDGADAAIYAASCPDWILNQPMQCPVQRFPLAASGVVVPTWTLKASGDVNTLLIDENSLFVGGAFWQFGGQERKTIAKIANATAGILDPTWIPQRWPYRTLALLSRGDGEVIVAGEADSAEDRELIRLNGQSGEENAEWRPWQSMSGSYDSIPAMTLMPDSKLYLADAYGSIKRTPAAGSTNGVEPNWWVPTLGFTHTLIALGPSELLLAGNFTQVDGQPRFGLARLLDVNPLLFIDHFE